MNAVVFTQYGPPEVLQFKDLPKPEPGPGEVLIKIHGASAHIGDTRIRRCDPFLVRLMFGLFRPRKNLVLGMECSGVVESVGSGVSDFSPGDEVFAWNGFSLGGYADYICLPERVKEGKHSRKGLVAIKPNKLSFGEAATVPAATLTVLQNFRKAGIKEGQSILINGASGSLGTFAIQMAKYHKAEVTAVCSSKNFELVKALGADHTIDYTLEDFTSGPHKYDIVYDAVMKSSRSKCRSILKPGGAFINNNGLPKMKSGDLNTIKDLIEAGHLKPVIDRSYSIEEIVEAHRYVDQGHKKGNVSILVSQ